MKPRGLFLSLRRYVCASVVHKCRNISHTFACGELALATDQKGRKYLFELKENGQLQLSSGKILHSTIIAGCPGQSFKTHLGTTGLVVRRPSLEEFTLLMARGPTPTYPKDILAMIGLMNVNHGSRVIEAGSGSGAMTLHLSKAGWLGEFYSPSENLTQVKRTEYSQCAFNRMLRRGTDACFLSGFCVQLWLHQWHHILTYGTDQGSNTIQIFSFYFSS